MWGSSFNDIAKKAAEMQEQAAASITSPVATSSFSMGSMFNMDSLQAEGATNPDEKKDELKNLAQEAMSQAKAEAITSSSTTFYNPLQHQVQQPVKQVQQPNRQQPRSKMKQPQSFMSNTKTNKNMNVNTTGGMPSMAMITPNHNSLPASLSFGQTAKATPVGSTTKIPSKNLFPSSAAKPSLANPKGKLSLPAKPKSVTAPQPIASTNKNLGNNNKTTNININTNVNANTNNKSTIPGGSKLKLNPPASSLVTKTPVNSQKNNNALRMPSKQEGGLVVGTSKQPSKPATGTNPGLTGAATQTQATGPAPTPNTTSKLMAPKPVPKQQNSFSKEAPQPNASKPVQPSTSASVSENIPGIPKVKSKLQQDPKNQQSAPTPASFFSPPPKKGTEAAKKVPAKAAVPDAANKLPAKAAVPASQLPAAAAAAAASTKKATTAAPEKSVAPEKGSIQPSNSSEDPAAAATPDENDGVLREQLRQQLQQQQEGFEKQLDQQRQQTEGRMQQFQRQFSEQLQRLEEHHRQETETTNAQHEASLAHWQQQLRDREILMTSQSQKAESDEMKSQQMLSKVSSELIQARELIADKVKEERKMQETHLNQLRNMEKQCNKKEDASNDRGQRIENLEKNLEDSKKETQNALDEFVKLKERAKGIAGELKGKRAECRTLSSEIDLLKGAKHTLQERITQLEATGMDMNTSSEETQAKLDSLQTSLDETKRDLDQAREILDEEKKNGQEALSKYKKKAQQSLAMANARSSSAVHAREEAEMEARAARATADTAMERAMKSELNGRQALAEAKVYVEEMKEEVDKYESVKAKLGETTKELKQAKSGAEAHKESSEKLRCELTSLSGRLEAEQATVEDLKEKFTSAENRCNELYDEVERLRLESQRHQGDIKRISEASKVAADSSLTSQEEAAAIVRGANAEAEATIAMLQQELRDSNKAIKELKETLLATIEEKDSPVDGGYSNGGNNTMNGNHQQPENGIPLFYAMEKQAELSQARDEITRMANLLGDAESTKQDALDEMQDMKRLMQDAQSKLQRQEQLQTKTPGNEQSLNLEYLKNIMLSYLNAGTIQEKKALLPVIGTVLCLTHEEQALAIEQLDKGSGSMMDSVTTSVLGGLGGLNWS